MLSDKECRSTPVVKRIAAWAASPVGLSPDPNYELEDNWTLWFWDEQKEPVPVEVPKLVGNYLHKPEAICQITIDKHSYLLLIEDGKPTSRYALILVSALTNGPGTSDPGP